MLKPFALILGCLALSPSAIIQAEDKAAPSDPQIAMIVVVADSVDIDAGKLALEKAKDPRVQEFAALMVRDHTALNEKATALAEKLGVTLQESPTSKSLKSNGDTFLARLRTLNGAEFDKAYIDNEVTFHQAVLDLVDKTLLPNTQNGELKSLLESARPIFVAHLDHAKTVQSALQQPAL